MDWLGVVGNYLGDLWRAIGSSMSFDSATLLEIASGNSGWSIAIGIAVMAGISIVVGKLVVLAINQLRGVKLLFAIGTASMSTVLQFIVQAASMWALGRIFLDDMPKLGLVIKVLFLSSAPLILSFTSILPILGPPLEVLYSTWSLGILWGVAQVVFHLNPFSALVMALGSWLVMQIFANTLGKPFGRLRDWVWLKITGRPLLLSSQSILDAFPEWEPESVRGTKSETADGRVQP